MKYRVEVDARVYEIEVGPEAVLVDGEPVTVDFESMRGSELRHLVLEGRSYTVRPRRSDGAGAWDIDVDGRTLRVTALDERRRTIRDLAGVAAAARGAARVTAPMPGLVVAVEVEEGDAVESGDGLVIIEAMKMENELKAEVAGRVGEIRVAAGQAVEKGETLLVIEPPAETQSPDAAS